MGLRSVGGLDRSLLQADEPSISGPVQFILHTQVSCFCLFASGIRTTPCDSFLRKDAQGASIYNRTGPHRASPTSSSSGSPPLLRASTHTPIVGHVSLWDRLPPLQVDRAPAAALRHYFLHNRRRRRVGMGQGRGRQVSLRQYVEPVPKGVEG